MDFPFQSISIFDDKRAPRDLWSWAGSIMTVLQRSIVLHLFRGHVRQSSTLRQGFGFNLWYIYIHLHARQISVMFNDFDAIFEFWWWPYTVVPMLRASDYYPMLYHSITTFATHKVEAESLWQTANFCQVVAGELGKIPLDEGEQFMFSIMLKWSIKGNLTHIWKISYIFQFDTETKDSNPMCVEHGPRLFFWPHCTWRNLREPAQTQAISSLGIALG